MARLDTIATLKEFRTRAHGTKNLNIMYQQDLAVPYATRMRGSTKIVLPTPSATWDEERWIEWEFAAEHELGHCMPDMTDILDLLEKKQIDTGKFFGALINIMDDHRQEHHDFEKWAGRKLRLSKGRRQFWDKFDQTNLGKSTDVHRLAMETMFVWDNYEREEWMHSLNGSTNKLVPELTPKQVEWLEKLKAGDYGSTLKSGITADQEYDLVKRIINEVFELDADEEEQQASGKGKGKGKKGEKAEGEADGEGEGEGADGEACDGDENSKATTGGEVSYEDLLAHNHGKEGERGGETYAPLKIHYDNKGYREFKPLDPAKYKEIDYVDGGVALKHDSYYRRDMDSEHGRGLAKHVRRLLQVRSRSTYQHGLKRGKISPKSIYRGAMNGEVSERVFKKRRDSDILDSAVFLLMDISGSMGGAKVVNAAISCRLLNDAIASIGMPLEIATFDDSAGPRHGIIKKFHKAVSGDVLLDRIGDACHRQMSSNSDGESILWAYDRLIRQKAKRKIMIVLSDGSPACGRGDADGYTRKIVKEIEQRGDIDILAIGIEDENVKRIYKQWTVINQSSELEAGLLKIIENKILK